MRQKFLYTISAIFGFALFCYVSEQDYQEAVQQEQVQIDDQELKQQAHEAEQYLAWLERSEK